MSGPLIILVGLIYLGIAVEQTWKAEGAMAIVYFGYAFSNIGLWLATK